MAKYSISVVVAPGVHFGIEADTVDELLNEAGRLKENMPWVSTQVDGLSPSATADAAYAQHSEWANEVDQPVTANTPEPASERVDPWSGQPVQEPARRPAERRTAPSRGNPASASQGAPGVVRDTDRFGNVWTVGLPEAPNCICGEPAALVKGKSRAGRPYTAYKCAKGAPGGDWQSKCDFHEYPN